MLIGNVIRLNGYIFKWYSWLWNSFYNFIFIYSLLLLSLYLILPTISLDLFIISLKVFIILLDLFFCIGRNFIRCFFQIWIDFRTFYFFYILIHSHFERLRSIWIWWLNQIRIRRLFYLIFHSWDWKGLIVSVNKRAVFFSLFSRKKFLHLVHQQRIRHNVFHVAEDFLHILRYWVWCYIRPNGHLWLVHHELI